MAYHYILDRKVYLNFNNLNVEFLTEDICYKVLF